MAIFNPKTIRGKTYTLEHLEPFSFTLETEAGPRVVAVRFTCHCFTEEITPAHTPDLRYTHDHETRAFAFDRHELSKLLPQLISELGSRSVYMSMMSNFFTLRQDPAAGFTGPYLVFFNVTRSTDKGVHVLMNVESAYMKPGMTERASPVKFTTLIEKTAAGRRVPRGPPRPSNENRPRRAISGTRVRSSARNRLASSQRNRLAPIR
jgi:hypothetical protein